LVHLHVLPDLAAGPRFHRAAAGLLAARVTAAALVVERASGVGATPLAVWLAGSPAGR